MSIFLGLLLVVVIGFGVGVVVRAVSSTLTMESPSEEVEPEWAKLRKLETGGFWIGTVERPLFFAALLMDGGWPILSSWLVFKLAYYWQGANFTAFPIEPPNQKQAAYIVAKRQLGANHVATQLVGTGLNILIALLGVAVSKSF